MTALAPILPLDIPQTFEGWSEAGAMLLAERRVLNFRLGDWLIAGLERYGERAREEAHRIARLDIERFAPIVETCRRFPEPQRHPALAYGHHEAVMRVSDDAQAHALLEKAERETLSVAAFKAEVRVRTNRQTSLLPDDDPEDRQYRAMAQAWNRASVAARQLFLEAAQDVGCEEEVEL